MRLAIIILALLIATFPILASDAMADDEVYRWVDENGVVHFGDRPPEQAVAESIIIPKSVGINTQPSSDPDPAPDSSEQEQAAEPPPSLAQQSRDARAEKYRADKERKEETAEACSKAQNIVDQLEPSPRVNVTHEDGSVTRMDDNDRLKTLGEAKAYVAENCSNR